MSNLTQASIGVVHFIGFALHLNAFLLIAADPAPRLDEGPTTVYVTVERAQLHSGPGEDYYPTGMLSLNASLEVYHQTKDDWLGVRPPKGSFSWVLAADAYLLPGGKVIEVTNPSAVSWIGSSLGSAKQYRWQVKLQAGEQLGVIGEQTTRDADDNETLWYKIAPPNGEFRWIEAKLVSAEPVVQSDKRSNKSDAATASTQRSANSSSGVVAASYQTGAEEGAVVLGSSDDYYDDSSASEPFLVEGSYPRTPMAGEIINGEVVVGEDYVPGEVIEGEEGSSEFASEYYEGGEYYDDGGTVEYGDPSGEMIFDDGEYVENVLQPRSAGTFAGWHAFELNDDGMRFTWLERLYGRARKQGPDPLQADPFSLAMQKGQVQPASPRAVEQMFPEGMPDRHYASDQSAGVSPGGRRHRPWRDPRSLGRSGSGSHISPTAAPSLSSRDSTLPTGADAPDSAPLTAGLQRLSNALQGGNGSLLSESTDPQRNVDQPNVNWYGVGQGTVNASLASTTVNVGGNSTPLPTAASNLDLNQLQVSLSEVVTQPMQTWSLQPIYDSARYYVEHGASAIERGQARLLMERVEEFADLAARSGYLALNRNNLSTSGSSSSAAPGPIMLASTTTNGVGSVVRSDFDRALGAESGYDATGWLVPVIAAGAGQPSHALTDNTGRILAYVTPSPGLNLDRYLNQAVGITGLRGYFPQLQAGHLQASRVVRLQ